MKHFCEALLSWHYANARDLPWRGETDPYRIWLSEIMLQQTRTETVKRYYQKFLAAFPDVFSLARADESVVMKLWEGMGYYSRARNLHKAARMVAEEMNGIFPKSAGELSRLPGVGAYASCAISSIAYGERVPALDGNQARVLARVLNYDRVLKTPADLYDQALSLMPESDAGEYNQALMGLGAMVCTPKNPDCKKCPVCGMCAAFCKGTQEQLPVKPEKLQRRVEKRAVALVLTENGRIFVRKRGKGLLQGLWEFPNYENARTPEDVKRCLFEDGVEAEYKCRLPGAKHVFTHLEWHMTGFLFTLGHAPQEYMLADREELLALPVPSALRVYREEALRILEEYEDA